MFTFHKLKATSDKTFRAWILEGAIFVLFLFTHLYKLTEIPHGINVDEMGMGYDAWCLANFGVDRYLYSFPVYFQNTGAGQSILYGYLAAILSFLTGKGMSAWIMRLPGVFVLASAIVTFGYTLKKYFGDHVRTILFLFSVAVFPSLIMMWRMGFDCNLMMPLTLIFFSFLIIMEIEKCHTEWYIFGAGLLCGIVLYTYVLSHLIIPLFLFIYLIYLCRVKAVSVRKVLLFSIPLCILAVPLILVHIVSMYEFDPIFLGPLTIYPIDNYRGELLSLSNISIESAIRFFKYLLFFDDVAFDSTPDFGTVYYISVPFILIGIIVSIKEVLRSFRDRKWTLYSLPIIWLIPCFLLGIAMEANTYRMNAMLGCICFFWCEGIVCTFRFVQDRCIHKRYVISLASVLSVIYLLTIFRFFGFYFSTAYTAQYDLPFFRDTMEKELKLIEQNNPASNIYMDGIQSGYLFYLGTTLTDPFIYHAQTDIPDALINKHQFHNIHFKNEEFVDSDGNQLIDLNGSYIVYKRKEEACAYLDRYPFTKTETDSYYVYLPDRTFTYEKIPSESVWWDLGVNEDGALNKETCFQQVDDEIVMVLVGATFDSINNAYWKEVKLCINGICHPAVTTERTDFAEKIGLPELTETGFVFNVELDSSDVNPDVSLIATSQDGRLFKYQL